QLFWIEGKEQPLLQLVDGNLTFYFFLFRLSFCFTCLIRPWGTKARGCFLPPRLRNNGNIS
ncbi:MAG: hypothetical protein AAGA67_10380, partial [Cyanobacteria bacterium P01_F01_bin.153]